MHLLLLYGFKGESVLTKQKHLCSAWGSYYIRTQAGCQTMSHRQMGDAPPVTYVIQRSHGRKEVKTKPLITDCTCQSKQVTDEEEDLLNSRKTRGAQKWTASALRSLIYSLLLNDPNSVSQSERPNSFILVGRFYACLAIILKGNYLITPDLNSTTDT